MNILVDKSVSFPHTEGATLREGGEIYEVAGRASGIGLERKVRLVTRLMKDRLLGCMGQVLQQDFWQG